VEHRKRKAQAMALPALNVRGYTLSTHLTLISSVNPYHTNTIEETVV